MARFIVYIVNVQCALNPLQIEMGWMSEINDEESWLSITLEHQVSRYFRRGDISEELKAGPLTS